MTSLSSDPPRVIEVNRGRNERKVWIVIALTTTTMFAGIIAGHWFGSMALVAEGWHMSTHAGAMLFTVLAYRFAAFHKNNPAFTFGTGKVGDLAGFASAVVLAIIAISIGWESAVRLVRPVPINFEPAILVAVVGLVINFVSALLLREDHEPAAHLSRLSNPSQQDTRANHARRTDHNLKAVYLHALSHVVLAVFAIVALQFGRMFGWFWMDPAMGIIGAFLIIFWSVRLMRDTSRVLLDMAPRDEALKTEIRRALETGEDIVRGVEIWPLGQGQYSAIVAIETPSPKSASHYRFRLRYIEGLQKITPEVSVMTTI